MKGFHHFLGLSLLIALRVESRKECLPKAIPNSDTVCVCNSSYCDDFPPLTPPQEPGLILAFETNKRGDRFKETKIKPNVFHQNLELIRSQTITIDKRLEYQKIFGFGGAFTDTTGMLLKSVPEGLAQNIIASYFSANGIEYSFGRVPVSGTDYSVRPYTYNDVPDDYNLTHFSLQKEDYEWKIPYIKLAKDLSPHPLKLISSSWSPPAWMKTVHEIKMFANLKGEPGGQYYQLYADYLVKFLENYKDNGLEFWGVAVQNEPVQDHGINGLNMTAEQQRDYIKMNLGPTLTKNGFGRSKVHLLIFDDTSPHLREYADVILSDEESAEYISGIAMHWYYNQPMGPFPELILDYVYQNYPQHFLLNTEACVLKGAGNGRWDYAENYAFDVIRDLNHWMVGWMEWNMALDLDGGPTWMKKHGCGGPVYIDPALGEAYKQPTFYALGHFSKFISPNSVRIYHELTHEVDGLSVLTAKRPDGAVVSVVLNTNDEQIVLNFIDSDNKYFSNVISGHSIQSYVWWQ